MKFEVKGTFRMSEFTFKPFSIEVEAVNEKVAVDKAKSLIGGNHKCRRNFIKVVEAKKVQ